VFAPVDEPTLRATPVYTCPQNIDRGLAACRPGDSRRKESLFMKSRGILFTVLICFIAMVVLGQTPPPTPPAASATLQQGPGVQAPQDARYAEWVAMKCKNPPAPRGGGRGPADAARGGARGGDNAAGPPAHREYMVTEIPGVIAAGQKWKSIWTGTGNN